MDDNDIRREIEQTEQEIDKRREALRECTVSGLHDVAAPSTVELLQDQLIFFESRLAQLRSRLTRATGH